MPSCDFQFRAEDNFPLHATLFMPARDIPPEAAIVINSATGVQRRYYARFATFLSERCGYAVLTYDYRGIADSRPDNFRAFEARLRDWPGIDMPAALEWMRRSIAPQRLFLIGHSAGGNLIGLIPNLAVIDAAVFVGAQLGYWRHWPARIRYAMAAIWYVAVPGFSRLFGYVPGWLGAGQHWPHGIAMELAQWCRHPDYLFGDPSLDVSRYAAFDAPLLAYTFADDPHATRTACEHLLSRFPGAVITHRHVDPKAIALKHIGHFGFFRPSCETLWQDCAAWLSAIQDRSGLSPPSTSSGPQLRDQQQAV